MLIVADSPQRAQMCWYKSPNNSSWYPCPYCLVSQTGDDGGDLGDECFDTSRYARTYMQYVKGRQELVKLGPGTRQVKRSTELGIVASKEGGLQCLRDLDVMALNASEATPAESLHADGLVRTIGLICETILFLR